MLTDVPVTIVVNGALLPSVVPARIVAGRVVAPLTPIVVQLVTRTAYRAASATVALERGERRIVVPVVLVENEIPFVALGTVVRTFGGSAIFDSPTKTLSIVLGAASTIASPAPFDPRGPAVAPTTVFTPAPPPATPRAADTGVPHPRRTAIPVTPSQPVPPAPDPTPTGRRR